MLSTAEQVEKIGSDFFLTCGGITALEEVEFLVVIDHRGRQADELLMAIGKVLFVIIGARQGRA